MTRVLLAFAFATALPVAAFAAPEAELDAGASATLGAGFAFECRGAAEHVDHRDVAELLGLAPNDPRLATAIRAALGKISLTDATQATAGGGASSVLAVNDPLDRLGGC